jgi:DNA-binding IclR family transcriptional regulator
MEIGLAIGTRSSFGIRGMTRPALSALRAIEIIDFMSQAPSQAYTLSELVRHTGTNVASLHAILSVLMRRGYLVRHPAHKTYRLSPALAAIGESVAASEPILGHARAAAESLASRTGLEATVMARTGEDVICLSRAAGDPRLRTSMKIGQRITLRPPLGGTYYAWASDEDEVDAWIARGDDADPDLARAALAMVRDRGFLVTIRSPAQTQAWRALAARGGGSHAKAERNAARALKELERALYQPKLIEPDAAYDVDFITAPLFDHTHQATYSITLNGFAGPLSGDEVRRYAGMLIEACSDVMRDSGVHPARRRA